MIETPQNLPPETAQSAPPSPDMFSEATEPQTPQQRPQIPNANRPQPEQVVLDWRAPARPFKKRNRQYYVTIGMIVFLISLILFFAGQFLPIAVVFAVAFLAYVLSAVPPEEIQNAITTYGIRTENNLYYWDELGRFWFTDKYGQKLLHVETVRFPNQITIVLGAQNPEEVEVVLSEVLLQEKPLPSSFDKAAAWLQEKIPLDTEA